MPKFWDGNEISDLAVLVGSHIYKHGLFTPWQYHISMILDTATCIYVPEKVALLESFANSHEKSLKTVELWWSWSVLVRSFIPKVTSTTRFYPEILKHFPEQQLFKAFQTGISLANVILLEG